jgi:RNA polymerase sigma-70 factor (ECF subfamily)
MDQNAALVQRLATGDPSALEEAYHLHAALCRAVAVRILHDDAVAEDAVQEAFATLWRRRDGLVVRTAGVAPWLVVVTRNAALTMLRADTRRRLREEREFVASPPVNAGDPLEAVAAGDAAVGLRTALDDLSAEQRDVIRMAYYERLTLAQVAERTGAPLGTVKRRAQLALQRLARIIGGDGT